VSVAFITFSVLRGGRPRRNSRASTWRRASAAVAPMHTSRGRRAGSPARRRPARSPASLRRQRRRILIVGQDRDLDDALMRRQPERLVHLVAVGADRPVGWSRPESTVAATVWMWKIAPIAGSSRYRPRWIGVSADIPAGRFVEREDRDVALRDRTLVDSAARHGRRVPRRSAREVARGRRDHPRDAAKRPNAAISSTTSGGAAGNTDVTQRRTRRARAEVAAYVKDDRQTRDERVLVYSTERQPPAPHAGTGSAPAAGPQRPAGRRRRAGRS